MKKFKKWLRGLKTRFLPFQNPVVKGYLAGVPLQVIKGTLRAQPDQDDAWLFHLMGKFDNIFDIGANIGHSALVAKVQGKDKKLLLADPNPEALSIAAKNLILNRFATNCDFITAFVSDADGQEQQFWTVGSGAAGSMYKGHAETAAAAGQSILAPTVNLDTLVEKVGWSPDFVKIDVEGAEAQVLGGAIKLAGLQKTWFMVEMHSPPELPMLENAKKILGWAGKTGYSVWYMRDACQLTSPDMIADRGKCHLLLLPMDTPYPDALKDIPQRSPIPDFI